MSQLLLQLLPKDKFAALVLSITTIFCFVSWQNDTFANLENKLFSQLAAYSNLKAPAQYPIYLADAQTFNEQTFRSVVDVTAAKSIYLYARQSLHFPTTFQQTKVIKLADAEQTYSADTVPVGDSQGWLESIVNRVSYQSKDINWRSAGGLRTLLLKQEEDGRLPLFVRGNPAIDDDDNIYLTAAGNWLAQEESTDLDYGLLAGPILKNANAHWPLSFDGSVFVLDSMPKVEPLSVLLEKKNRFDSSQPLIIAISPSLAELKRLAAMSKIAKHYYWFQPNYGWLVSFLLFFVAAFGGWRLARSSAQKTALIMVAVLALLLLTQYLFVLRQIWLSLLPSMILSAFALWIGYFVIHRRQQFLLAQQQVNRLLKLSIADFYRERKLEKIQPILFSTNPDQALADAVFDIALQAEASQNHGLSKRLLSWIESSGLTHPDSEQKLKEMRELEAAAALDATLVIGAGQNNRSTLTDVLSIKEFGRYQVEGVLGKGAMGIVYQGVDPKINRHVAIKTLSLAEYPDHDDMEIVRDRFFREAETAGNLSHANIVTIYDVGEQAELAYIAMDLLTGAPLSQFVKEGQLLPVPLLYQLMIQIADALDYAHRHQVVHRDVKPANIIYDDDIQRVTMTDFGIAYVADNSKTRTGTIMGSPYYMSPEQVMGHPVDGRSDIFSLGVTFYQLLSGHLPFDGESIASVAFHITKSKHKAIRHWNSKLPSSAVRITNKALNKDPDSRYQTMAEFKQALINALKRDFKKAPLT